MTEDQIGSPAIEGAVQQQEAPPTQETHEKIEQMPAPTLEEVLVAKTGLASLMEKFPQSEMTPEIEKVIQIAAEGVARMESALDKARVAAGFPSLNELISKMAQSPEPSTPLYPDTSGNLYSAPPAPTRSTAGHLT